MLKKILIILFVIISVFVILMPFAWMVSISFRPDDQVMKMPPRLLGGKFTTSTYTDFLERYDFFRIFFNSVFVSIVPAIVATLSSALAGYGFAKYDFKGKNILFLALMATIMIPIFVILVPLYLIIIDLEWIDSYNALIIPFLANPFGIFLMRQFIYSVPNDLINAGRIDGSSEFGIFFRIVLPSIMPVIASLILIIFVGRWDDWLWPSIITKSEQFKVITVKLSQISRENAASTNWNITMAGTVMSTAPIVFLFLFMQRFFIKSITMTGIK